MTVTTLDTPFVSKGLELKNRIDMPPMAVGMLEDPKVALQALAGGDTVLVGVARGMLRNPYWGAGSDPGDDGQIPGSRVEAV